MGAAPFLRLPLCPSADSHLPLLPGKLPFFQALRFDGNAQPEAGEVFSFPT